METNYQSLCRTCEVQGVIVRSYSDKDCFGEVIWLYDLDCPNCHYTFTRYEDDLFPGNEAPEGQS